MCKDAAIATRKPQAETRACACGCGRFFEARRPWQRFFSAACRAGFHKSNSASKMRGKCVQMRANASASRTEGRPSGNVTATPQIDSQREVVTLKKSSGTLVAKQPSSRRRHTTAEKLRAVLAMLKFRGELSETEQAETCFTPGEKTETLGDLLERLAREARVSVTTLFRWKSAYSRFGMSGLVEHERNDRGVSRLFRDRPHAALFVLRMRAGGSSIDAIHRELARRWPIAYGASRVPSYNSVRRLLNSMGVEARPTRKKKQSRKARP